MLTQPQFRQIWNEAKMEVGLGADDQVVPHILRHTCASRLVQGGIDIRRVQMWLGHQTLQMTMRYAHLATNDLDSCVIVLETRPAELETRSPETPNAASQSPLEGVAAKPRKPRTKKSQATAQVGDKKRA